MSAEEPLLASSLARRLVTLITADGGRGRFYVLAAASGFLRIRADELAAEMLLASIVEGEEVAIEQGLADGVIIADGTVETSGERTAGVKIGELRREQRRGAFRVEVSIPAQLVVARERIVEAIPAGTINLSSSGVALHHISGFAEGDLFAGILTIRGPQAVPIVGKVVNAGGDRSAPVRVHFHQITERDQSAITSFVNFAAALRAGRVEEGDKDAWPPRTAPEDAMQRRRAPAGAGPGGWLVLPDPEHVQLPRIDAAELRVTTATLELARGVDFPSKGDTVVLLVDHGDDYLYRLCRVDAIFTKGGKVTLEVTYVGRAG